MIDNRKLISDCVSDICELRKTILYCEGRILQKQIVIQELTLALDLPPDDPSDLEQTVVASMAPPAVAPTPEPIALRVRMPSAKSMLEDAVSRIPQAEFTTGELRAVVLKLYPGASPKLKHGLYPAINALLLDKTIFKGIDGYRRKPVPLE